MDPESPKKRRGCLGLATKTVLGCAAFAIGAFVALVLCLPWLLEGPIRSVAEQGFGEEYKGSLAVADLELSWWNEVEIREAVLYDPDKREVGRVSAVLPSLAELLSRDGPMRVSATLDADLVADDAGITNLQRALEPRRKRPADDVDRDSEDSDALSEITKLDLEADLTSRRLSWSDKETRRSGKPFEVRDLAAKLVLKPGEPITFRAAGQVVSDPPGALEIDATVHGPIELAKPWPLGPVDANVRIEKFSTAMVDGVAGLEGRLAEVIGPTFDLRIRVERATPEQGGIELDFAAERTQLAFAGEFAGGSLRTRDGSPVRLVVGVPKGFVSDLVAPALPARTTVAWEEGDRPWSVTIANLALPIPEAGPGPTGVADRILARLVADVDVDLPARISFENAETKAAGISPSIAGVRAKVRFAPGEAPTAHLETALDTGQPGRIVADATLGEAWSVREAKLVVDGVSTRAIDALAGQQGRLATALGPTLTLNATASGTASTLAGTAEATTENLSLQVSASKEGDRIRATGDQGLFVKARSLAPLAGFLPAGAKLDDSGMELSIREISVSLAPDGGAAQIAESLACELSLELGGLVYADESTRAAGVELSVRDFESRSVVAPGRPLTVTAAASVSTGANDPGGRLDASASVPDPWFFLRGEGAKPPPIDADVRFAGLPAALLDSLAGKPGVATGLFGERADLEVKAAGASADAGTFRAKLASPSTSVALAARLENGVVVAVDEPALDVNATVSRETLDALLGASLPAGAKASLVDAKEPLRIVVESLRFPLPTGEMNSEALANASLRARITAPDLAYTDPKANAVVRDLAVTADLAPGKLPSAAVSAKIDGEPAGEIAAEVRALDPPAMLAEPDGLERFRVALDVSAKSVPTGLVDALAAQEGLLVDVLGATIDVALHSDGISKSAGTFTASLESPRAKVTCDRGSLKDGVLHLEKVGGNQEALLARVPLTPLFSERVVGSLVPMAVDLRQPEGAPPVSLSVEQLAMPLDGDLSKLDALVRLNLGQVTYKLLPGLESLLGAKEAKVVDVPEIRVPIQKGVASYAGLPIRIGGRDYPFQGTFNLVDKSFKMETEVPLSVLGKKVSDKLDTFRDFLDPNLLVPLELRGTWKSPKLRVGDDFLKKVAEDALKKQGGSLLDGLLKKKEKN